MKELDRLTVKELRALAKKAGVKGYSRLKKAQLIELLKGVIRAETKEENTAKTGREVSKAQDVKPKESPQKSEPPRDPLEDLGELPYSHGIDMIDFLPVNPELGHVIWDVSGPTWERIAEAEALILQVVDASGKVVFQDSMDKGVREYFVHFSGLDRGPYRGVLLIGLQGRTERLMESGLRRLPPNLPGKGKVVFGRVPWDVPLYELSGPEEVSPEEFPKRPRFLVSQPDETPYTRRWK